MAMAIDLYHPAGMSPRISFSYYLNNSPDNNGRLEEEIPLKSSNYSSNVEFDFHVDYNCFGDQEPPWADELFYNGRILPTEIKKKTIKKKTITTTTTPQEEEEEDDDGTSNITEETGFMMRNNKTNNEKQGNSSCSSISFWKFKRSKSLNCLRAYKRALFTLPLLSRSKSSGSDTNIVKPMPLSKEQSSHKIIKSTVQRSMCSWHQKPPLMKKSSCGSQHGNGNSNYGVRVDPVLNIPPMNVSCLGSVFSLRKIKNRK